VHGKLVQPGVLNIIILNEIKILNRLQHIQEIMSDAFFFLSKELAYARYSMVNNAISKDVHEWVIWLVEHGYAPPDICEFFSDPPLLAQE
jgi:hypothetical protein